MCLCVCGFVRTCAAGRILFYRPVEQKYGSQLESNAAGRHLEELCRFLLGIIGAGKQVIAWRALNCLSQSNDAFFLSDSTW